MKPVGCLIVALALMQLSCKSEEKDSPSASVSYISISCSSSTDCVSNASDGKTFYALLFANADCTSFDGTFDTNGGLVKGPVACSGGTCTGTENTGFTDFDYAAVSVPAAGTYSVFGFIDIDGDESPSDGEPGVCNDSVAWDGAQLAISFTGDLTVGP